MVLAAGSISVQASLSSSARFFPAMLLEETCQPPWPAFLGCGSLLQTLVGLVDEHLGNLTILLDVLLEGTSELALVVFLLVIEPLLPLGPGLELSGARKPELVLCLETM